MTFIPPPDWILSARGTELIIVTLAFGLGATLGSFLNVVVHRAPRGESVVGGRSYCPSCGSPVRARDNLPILGWLLLRGRCRDCRHPIPAHYPLVEAACGGLLAAVAVAELSSGGRAGPAAIDRILMRGDAGPVFAWFCRSALLLVLVVWAEFARRGRTVSWRAVGMAVAGVAAAGVLVPSLAPPGILSLCGCGSSGGGWSQPLAAAVVGGGRRLGRGDRGRSGGGPKLHARGSGVRLARRGGRVDPAVCSVGSRALHTRHGRQRRGRCVRRPARLGSRGGGGRFERRESPCLRCLPGCRPDPAGCRGLSRLGGRAVKRIWLPRGVESVRLRFLFRCRPIRGRRTALGSELPP